MNRKNSVFLIAIYLGLTGCAELPHSGPSLGAMKEADTMAFSIQHVSPQKALTMRQVAEKNIAQKIHQDLHRVRQWNLPNPNDERIQAGDKIHITLWTNQISLFSSNSLSSPLHKTRLGTFEVDETGAMQLPYIGKVQAAGLSLSTLSEKIDKMYKATGEFIDPNVSIKWGSGGHLYGVLISGAVKHPGLVSWHPGGLSLARILAQSGLENTSVQPSASGGTKPSSYANMVRITYRHQQVTIPFSVIYIHHLQVPSGAHILVTRSAPYKITLLGGGTSHQGRYTFGSLPTVNAVISASGGLNPNTADDRQIFVMQPSHLAGVKSILYVLKWNTPEGLLAAQRMPLQDGDVVYISAAPVVPVEKAAQIFSSFLLPPAIIGGAIK